MAKLRRKGRGPRPWKSPPAPARRSHETIRGIEILTELPNPLGIFLWLLLRDVELWAGSPPALRSHLFVLDTLLQPPPEMLDEIAADAFALRTMITREAAGGGAVACRNIAAWASERAPNTALYYAWAAAAVSTQSATLAREVASYARRVSDSPLAESWLRRAIALARTEDGWATYGRAYCDLGDLLSKKEQYGQARAAFVRTLRVCRRHGLPRGLRASALLGLLRLALIDGTLGTADPLQRRLLRLYAAGHPEALRTRLAVARALVDHGNYPAADALLDHPSVLRGAADDRAAAAQLAGIAKARASEPH